MKKKKNRVITKLFLGIQASKPRGCDLRDQIKVLKIQLSSANEALVDEKAKRKEEAERYREEMEKIRKENKEEVEKIREQNSEYTAEIEKLRRCMHNDAVEDEMRRMQERRRNEKEVEKVREESKKVMEQMEKMKRRMDRILKENEEMRQKVGYVNGNCLIDLE